MPCYPVICIAPMQTISFISLILSVYSQTKQLTTSINNNQAVVLAIFVKARPYILRFVCKLKSRFTENHGAPSPSGYVSALSWARQKQRFEFILYPKEEIDFASACLDYRLLSMLNSLEVINNSIFSKT